MKARRTTPVEVSLTHPCGLEITQHKKMLKIKVAPDELLKTKGGESALDGLMKTKKLTEFPNDCMIGKELASIFTIPQRANPARWALD